MKDCQNFDFGSVASSYDAWYDTDEGRLYDVLEKQAVERMLRGREVTGTRLLDVGCGTGHWSDFFSTKGFVVTGVDVAPEMIAVARRKAIPNAPFAVADAHSLPFGEGEFDVVAAMATLEFLRDPDTVVREMARCTRSPGGLLLVGGLNALAPINIRRQAAEELPYTCARFFTAREVSELLNPYGNVRVAVSAFAPRFSAVWRLASLTDFVGRLLHSPVGAWIVGRAIR